MSGKVDEGTRKKEEAEGKGRRTERGKGEGGPQAGPWEPQGGPREAPRIPQGGPRRPHEAPGAPTRSQYPVGDEKQ